MKAQGGKELKKHLEGKRITQRQAIKAKCFDCMGGYRDGRENCEIPDCSLYAFMPYKSGKKSSKTTPVVVPRASHESLQEF